MKPSGIVLAAVLALLPAAAADAQVFIASKPNPAFTIGPLFVRASVTPALGPITVDVLWSLVVPPTLTPAALQQDLYLLWPGEVVPDRSAGAPDPALAAYVTARGYTVVAEGRARLFAQALYQMDGNVPPEPLPGGAPFVTVVRESGPLGLTSPATWIRIPWNPRLVNRAWLMQISLVTRGLVKPKPATWAEQTLWGQRYRFALSFNEVRQRVVFPLYVEHRNRVVRLADDPAQLIVNFADLDHLKIDELSPPNARRQVSQTLESTETVTLFLDTTDAIVPQTLSVQFGYFSGLQQWAPILIPVLFFVAGNVVAVVIRVVTERFSKRWIGRLHVGSARKEAPARESGVVLPRETLARIVPGRTTHDEVLRVCGPEVDEHESLRTPGRRTLVYQGQRVVPQRRPIFGWLATVSYWAIEHHEVEIDLEDDVVTDIRARVRRSRLTSPDAAR
ncbi:MAG: hypothetical protein ACRELS_20595 [Candidatus Rokuibacteriota bacterium]